MASVMGFICRPCLSKSPGRSRCRARCASSAKAKSSVRDSARGKSSSSVRLRYHSEVTNSSTIKGLHSSNFQLNVSTFCGIRWVVAVIKTAQVEPPSVQV